MSAHAPDAAGGPIVFAYDGSALSKGAVHEAAELLGTDRDAVVLTVWQNNDLGFVPIDVRGFDHADGAQVRGAAEAVAGEGASLAQAAGFRAQAMVVEAAPTWQGIVEFADERSAAMIVLGSHGRTRLRDVVLGSVAGDVAKHSRRAVLITHPPIDD